MSAAADKIINTAPMRIVISRTDSIGDVMLTLPMCGVLKKFFPACEVFFIGRTYTKSVIEACIHVDTFLNWDDWREASPQKQIDALMAVHADAIIHVFPRKEILWLAKRAAVPIRIATGRRLQTITKCNKLVFFTRRNSTLHEAQLNMKLLKPLGIEASFSLEEIAALYGFEKVKALPEKFAVLIDKQKKNIILHPGSRGSAVEWGFENFELLAKTLPTDKTKIFITGTQADGEAIRKKIDVQNLPITDLTGKLSLDELVSFIANCDALVAASTGPLHIAAASGIQAVGLYSPKRPIHPGRWAPIGKKAHVIVANEHPPKAQHLAISPQVVAQVLMQA